MFHISDQVIVVSMSQTDWSDVDMSLQLPTGTVTLLLADVEGSTRLWEADPHAMTAAIARLNATADGLIATHQGVRPTEQGEGDSFVAAFARGSDAVACALAFQRTDLGQIKLRIGINTGEIQLRDDNNYTGSTINRTARIRDLAHGGQTLVSGATEHLVLDRLPSGAWLTELGAYPLRDLPRPERVLQLCHPDIRQQFPPLRTRSAASHNLPVHITRFVGRGQPLADLHEALPDHRLVTLTGAGGVGKTRLAVQLAERVADEFRDGVFYVDLAPLTDPDAVVVAAARGLSLADRPGRSTTDTLLRFIADKQLLLVLDNCEHLLDAVADLVLAVISHCPASTLLATSREPIGIDGEVTWRVPSLPLADEAIELFADRARRARPDFQVDGTNLAVVSEICRRLDGMPLAIELAAARTRALSLTEIVHSLHDRFRLLTGGSRTAVRRQQTLRASVDWSHALLTDPERVLFRRLAVFMGGFDLDAVRAVVPADEVERFQAFDQLSLLIDKSLVTAEEKRGRTRYRLLETVRQYAQEKLGESGEADAVRDRHRDYFVEMSAALDTPTDAAGRALLWRAEANIDNFAAAFTWCLENSDAQRATALACSLYPMWASRGRLLEGMAWLDSALAAEGDVTPATRARALADVAMFAEQAKEPSRAEKASEALRIARELDDSALLLRALIAVGSVASTSPSSALQYTEEAAGLARRLGDRVRLGEILAWRQQATFYSGNPAAGSAAAAEGIAVAAEIGNTFIARACRWGAAWSLIVQGRLDSATTELKAVATEAAAAGEPIWHSSALAHLSEALAFQGDIDAARAAIEALMEVNTELGGAFLGLRYGFAALVELAAGDLEAATAADTAARRHLKAQQGVDHLKIGVWRESVCAWAAGDFAEAGRLADSAVAGTYGWHRMLGHIARARVAIAQGNGAQVERDVHDALAIALETGAQLAVPEALDCLACVTDNYQLAARLFGAADGVRLRSGEVRFKILQADYERHHARVHDALGESEFDTAYAEGAAMSTEEVIAYVQRGRGERKRSTSGWSSLTAAELDVVRLVGEGLPNKEIASRLFISPRTVESHLTHVYTKMGIASRVQLAQESARRARPGR